MTLADTSDDRAQCSCRIEELAQQCSGELRGRGGAAISRFEIDSRNCGPGALFVALAGEHRDGHEFLEDALGRGAEGVLIKRALAEREPERVARLLQAYPATLLLVAEPLPALQRLASAHLSRFPDLVRVAVTGSNGKTTTKELIAGVLHAEAPTFRTAGNYNSEIGVPLSAFSVTAQHRYAVFECAMNRPGEIEVLAAIVRPHVAVITNIAAAHIGFLGSLEAIAAEKKAIFSRFTGSERGFVYEDEPFFAQLAGGVDGAVVPFGERSTPGFEGYRLGGLRGGVLHWSGREIRLQLPGRHNLHNALAAISVACSLGCASSSVVRGLETAATLFGRGELLTCRADDGEITVLQDCYNANQHSMEAAIQLIDEACWKGRKLLVLGAMKELGEFSAAQHRAVVDRALASSAEMVLLFGHEFVHALTERLETLGAEAQTDRLRATAEFVELERWVHATVRGGDLLLLKGSRSVRLERVSEGLGARVV